MNYSNLPVYIEKRTGINQLVSGIINNYIPAQNISVDYSAQNDALRLLGVDIDQSDQFTHGAALQAKISFNSYINSETSGALNTVLNSSGNDSYNIRLGNNIYDNCYLSSYDISVEPFKPTVLSASYVVNNAPKVNLNDQEYIDVVTPATTNYLLYSDNLTGTNYNGYNILPNLGYLDPTGGNKAVQYTGLSQSMPIYEYYLTNTDDFTWTGIASTPLGGTELTTLKTNNDVAVYVGFTGLNFFFMGGEINLGIYISNNGIITFSNPYANYQNRDFPIPNADYLNIRNFIAPYWTDMFAGNSGSIWYKQQSDRFIVEYNGVFALADSQPQTYQVHFIYATSVIEIRYKTITPSDAWSSAKPNIGIQWKNSFNNAVNFINYNLAQIDASKSLKFILYNYNSYQYAYIRSIQYVFPSALRTFSIYLKRISGSGNIKYTTDGGIFWTTITPALTTSWTRYTFPATKYTQQIGILIETYNDSIAVYGAQLEDGDVSTAYIPTLGQPVTRPESTTSILAYVLYPQINLTTGFANKMINGDTCAVSSTTGFISTVQNSMRYSVNCGRSPIYNIGTTNANDFILDTVEKQMDISSTDLTSFIDFSGYKLTSDLNLTLKDAQNIIGSVISMKSGASIYSQQSSVQEGDTLVTQVSIKEIVV